MRLYDYLFGPATDNVEPFLESALKSENKLRIALAVVGTIIMFMLPILALILAFSLASSK